MADPFDQMMSDVFNISTGPMDAQVPSAVPMELEHPNIECALNDLKAGGILIHIQGQLLGGYTGMVYVACAIDGCRYILKVQKSNRTLLNREGEYADKAGMLKIGPRVIGYGVCTNFDDNRYKWILMERIPGRTLTQLFPDVLQYINVVMDNYLALINHGIVQNDLKGDNIIIDDKGRVYLIDYGSAVSFERKKFEYTDEQHQPSDEEIKYQLIEIAGMYLVASLTNKWSLLSKEENRFALLPKEEQEEMVSQLVSVVNLWVENHFENGLSAFADDLEGTGEM